MSDQQEKVFIWMVEEQAWLNPETMLGEMRIENAYGFEEREAYRICQHSTEGWLPHSFCAPKYIPVRECDIIAIQETFSESSVAEHKQLYGEF